jgi:hypothetical protein
VPLSFTWLDLPTRTISDGPEENHDAVVLGGLFLVLHANRKWLTDAKLKTQYIDSVKKSRDETLALIKSFDVQSPEVPECSSTKKKRSNPSENRFRPGLEERDLISGAINFVKGAVNHVTKIVGCAGSVIKNVVVAVEKSTPNLNEIENLTDTLAEIGKILEEKNENKPTSTKEKSSSTTSSFSSSSLCSASNTITDCQVICTLTSTNGVRRRLESTTQLCSTSCTQITGGCSMTAVTSTTTVEPSNISLPPCSPKNQSCSPNALVPPPGYKPSCSLCLRATAGNSVS